MWNKNDEFDEVEKYKNDQKRYNKKTSNQRTTSSDSRFGDAMSSSRYSNKKQNKKSVKNIILIIIIIIAVFKLGSSIFGNIFNNMARTNRINNQIKNNPTTNKDNGKSKLDYEKLSYKGHNPDSEYNLGINESDFSFFAQVKSDVLTLNNTSDENHKNKKFIQVNNARKFASNNPIYVNVEKINNIPKKGDIIKISGGIGEILNLIEKKELNDYLTIDAKSIIKQDRMITASDSKKAFENNDAVIDFIEVKRTHDSFDKNIVVVIFEISKLSDERIDIDDLFTIHQNGVELEDNTFGPENMNIINNDVLDMNQLNSVKVGSKIKLFNTYTLKNKNSPLTIVNYNDDFSVKYIKTFK